LPQITGGSKWSKKWSDAWMLKLNVNKCKTVSYGRHINLDYFYYIENEESTYKLEKVDFIKDLGVTFDSQLKFDKHIYEKINKLIRY
jgi:hypothetical protein